VAGYTNNALSYTV
jgi:hypothetical protein